MLNRYSHMWRLMAGWVAAAILAVVAAGCSGREDDGVKAPQIPVGVEYQAGFFLTVSDVSTGGPTGSRAPEGDYDPGSGWENYIDLDNRDIRVLVFDEDDRFVRELSDFDVVPYAETPGSKTYHLICRVKEDEKWEPEFKLMVLANWGEYPAMTADGLPGGLWGSEFEYDAGPLGRGNLIPLFGVKESGVELVENQYVSVGTIHLLRALAKVEVTFSDPEGFWEVERMELTRHNVRGLCAPTGVMREEDYVKGTYEGDYVGTPSVPAGVETDEAMAMPVVEENGRWMMYVPEYRNVGRPEGERARIYVRFKESSVEYDQYIDFKDYKTGKAFDILRNNWYRFELKKRPEYQDVTVEVDVRFYNSMTLRPGFGQ